MSNPIIAKALEQQASLTNQSVYYKKSPSLSNNGNAGSSRRRIIDKLNSYKAYNTQQQQNTNITLAPQMNSSLLFSTNNTLNALNHFFMNADPQPTTTNTNASFIQPASTLFN